MSAASKWLKDNHSDFRVQKALKVIQSMLKGAGKHANAYSLFGLPPDERARIALTRLRERGISPSVILQRSIAVAGWFQTEEFRGREFRNVQTAKVLHRLASGTDVSNSYWKFPRKYPRSEGRVLRHFGKWFSDLAEYALDDRNIT